MRIMLYSQHVLGIGHFFRSMEIARALNRHEVYFVEGGEPLTGFIPPPHVTRLMLPPLMMDAEFQAIHSRARSIDAIKRERRDRLMDAFRGLAPDVLITELFPFGRKAFRFELMPLLEAIQEQRLPTRVVCSLRDILVEKKDPGAYEEGVLRILNAYFHLLLIHSDPRFMALNETFERVERITIPVHYTGFVSRSAPHTTTRPHCGKVIVASSGGGSVGADLLASVVQAVKTLPDPEIRLRVFMGPFMDPIDRDHLTALTSGDSRIVLEPFASNFMAELRGADLSISMAGYNTCMDLMAAGVKALVFPFPQNREQHLRASRFEKLGRLARIQNLDPQHLARVIQEALAAPAPSEPLSLDLSGARTTALLIEKHFGQR